jgi:hypothetical protein
MRTICKAKDFTFTAAGYVVAPSFLSYFSNIDLLVQTAGHIVFWAKELLLQLT